MILTIGGFFASGKSLLGKLCNTHPRIEITDEFYCFFRVGVPYKKHISGLRKDWRKSPIIGERDSPARKKHIQNVVFLTRYFIGLQAYRRGLIRSEQVEQILRRIFPHASIIGDVGPRYLFYASETLSHCSSCLPTIVYRDCRDVAGRIAHRTRSNSWANTQWVNKHLVSTEKVTRKWVWAIEEMERYTSQIHTIRYEDLVTDPPTVIAEFCRLMDIDSQGIDYHTVHTNDIGSYKQWLSKEEIDTVLGIAGPTMERLGYKI